MTPTEAHHLLQATLYLLRALLPGFHAQTDLDALHTAHALLVGVVLRLRDSMAEEDSACP